MGRGVVECEEVALEYGLVAKCSDVSFDRFRPQSATLSVRGS